MTKKNKIVGVVVLFVIILFSYFVGSSTASTALGEEKVNHDELVSHISEKESELDQKKQEEKSLSEKIVSLQTDVEKKEADLKGVEAEYSEAQELIKERDKLKGEISKLGDQVKGKQAELKEAESQATAKKKELDASVKEKEAELASLDSAIVKKQEAPKVLPAGTFIVGHDIPANRYSASIASGSDNFVVYSASGDLKVNTILGGEYGVPEHIFFAEDGDIIETSSPTAFAPVE